MATTVNIVQQSFTPFGWSEANFDWGSARADKPWAEMGKCSFLLSVGEGITVAERSEKRCVKEMRDAAKVAIRIGKSYTPVFVERIKAADETANVINKAPFQETFKVSGSNNRQYLKTAKDSVKITDSNKKTINKKTYSNFKFIDGYTDYIKFLIRHYETIAFAERVPKNIDYPLADKFKITANYSKHAGKNSSDTISFADSTLYGMAQALYEPLVVGERLAKTDSKYLAEKPVTVSGKTAQKVNFYRLLGDGLCLTDKVRCTNKFQRTLSEQFRLADLISKRAIMPKHESFEMWEAFPRSANATIGDLEFYNTVLTETEFLAQDVPLGYTPWKEFIAGDWTYQKALFKLAIKNTGTQGNPVINNWQLNIDVPDVYERLAVSVPAQANYRIDFNRRFYSVPDVAVTVRGDQRLVVSDLCIDETGLSLTLLDGSGNISSGEIAVRAEGY